ncbi:hypothetical protein CDAR_71381 [Caerostris darwini]|uniref:Uncharacterized protein n=1 Tax=Caerostris darwini TaxID=1538125 RepID=A0AAV4RKG3_9ARAC|nr:hypothetical protein CDAR_71381 [Caerostris darwini]
MGKKPSSSRQTRSWVNGRLISSQEKGSAGERHPKAGKEKNDLFPPPFRNEPFCVENVAYLTHVLQSSFKNEQSFTYPDTSILNLRWAGLQDMRQLIWWMSHVPLIRQIYFIEKKICDTPKLSVKEIQQYLLIISMSQFVVHECAKCRSG